MGLSSRFNTQPLAGSLTILDTDNIMQISLIVLSGTCEITGNMSFRGGASSAITLTAGMSLTISENTNAPISGITLQAIGGITGLVFAY